jgi:hypothetical protein
MPPAGEPTWRIVQQGHLKPSLVTCPVPLYPTNSSGDVRFNVIIPKTSDRIEMITTDPNTGLVDEVERPGCNDSTDAPEDLLAPPATGAGLRFLH